MLLSSLLRFIALSSADSALNENDNLRLAGDAADTSIDGSERILLLTAVSCLRFQNTFETTAAVQHTSIGCNPLAIAEIMLVSKVGRQVTFSELLTHRL